MAQLPNHERRWPGFFLWLGKRRNDVAKPRARVVSVRQSQTPRQWHDV